MTPEERQLALAEVASVDDATRALIVLAMRGLCPFCLCDTERDSHVIAAVKRGLTGDRLTAEVELRNQRDTAAGVDSDSGHALDCRMLATIRAETARIRAARGRK